MCGIVGIININNEKIPNLVGQMKAMNRLIAHRGPDDEGIWCNQNNSVGLAHRRLTIIDLSDHGHQPMIGHSGATIVFNGEIYNYIELRNELKASWDFQSNSDTEVILAAYHKYGRDCVNHLRGMFSFAIWDGSELFCARDRFGIKPFYYTVLNGFLYFASEVKALLPFVPSIETDEKAFAEYLTFQYLISNKTLFKHVHQLLPGHSLISQNREIKTLQYWDISYDIDYDHNNHYFEHQLQDLLTDSIDVHLRSDVPVGSYVSGGIDSSLIAILASQKSKFDMPFFHGKFSYGQNYDESDYASEVAKTCNRRFECIDITATDFQESIKNIIYHLDYPVAGPGAFPQYMVSKLASEHVKVILGGQGGDEIFGGYARYVLAYFEQAINSAIEGTYKNGNFVVTPESIIPNLTVLKEYKPMIKKFWAEGLFGPLDERYFRLIDRSVDMEGVIEWDALDREYVFQVYSNIFNNRRNVRKEAYFDSMTHFDFKCLLPALLQVEDRVSMAHGLEARVPLLDHKLVEFAATIPADIKFKGGQMKYLLKQAFKSHLPAKILQRRDKMGFPVPLNEWFKAELREFICDILNTGKNKHRDFINYELVLKQINDTGQFSRKLWAMLSIELWYQTFHDRVADYQNMIRTGEEN